MVKFSKGQGRMVRRGWEGKGKYRRKKRDKEEKRRREKIRARKIK